MADEMKKEGDCCGSKSGCGSRCCCAKKIIVVVILLLLGGVIGFLVGTRCSSSGMRSMCPMMDGNAMMAPATPPAAK